MSEEPEFWPSARGIVTTDYNRKEGGSVATYWHDCGGEWKKLEATETQNGTFYYRYRCERCDTSGRDTRRFPVVTTS